MNKTKLSLQDIYIGDVVEEVSPMTKRPSMPMRVSAIFEDGDLYLDFEGNEADPWEAKISECRDVEIDFDILKSFGFSETGNHRYQREVDGWMISVDVTKPFDCYQVIVVLSNIEKNRTVLPTKSIGSIRELQHFFYEQAKKPLKLELV